MDINLPLIFLKPIAAKKYIIEPKYYGIEI